MCPPACKYHTPCNYPHLRSTPVPPPLHGRPILLSGASVIARRNHRKILITITVTNFRSQITPFRRENRKEMIYGKSERNMCTRRDATPASTCTTPKRQPMIGKSVPEKLDRVPSLYFYGKYTSLAPRPTERSIPSKYTRVVAHRIIIQRRR